MNDTRDIPDQTPDGTAAHTDRTADEPPQAPRPPQAPHPADPPQASHPADPPQASHPSDAPQAPHPADPPPPISALLDAAAGAALPVLRAVRDDQMGWPTPCSEYDVRALLNHLFQVVVAFQTLAAKKDVDFSRTPDRLGEYGARWPDRFADETVRLVEAWAAPGAEEGLTGGMQLPARTVGAMVLLDLTVHAWDLARATGRPYAPAAGCVTELRALAARMAPTARTMNVFAAPVPVPPGASDLDVLLAETGRDPHWTAG